MLPRKVGNGFDHAATEFGWTLPVLCGSADPASAARYDPDTTDDGFFAAPDHCTFDSKGRLWITTDQGEA